VPANLLFTASAAVGVAVALIRGFPRHGAKTIGNFSVDLVRGTIYILLPSAAPRCRSFAWASSR
jgi:K+-transporting ATPase A subunit